LNEDGDNIHLQDLQPIIHEVYIRAHLVDRLLGLTIVLDDTNQLREEPYEGVSRTTRSCAVPMTAYGVPPENTSGDQLSSY